MQNGSPFVFLAHNNHVADCGQPPQVSQSGKNYYGYFENEFGEQFVFEYDFDAHRGRLWAGDAGWEQPVIVTESKCPMILGNDERAWLSACWQAVAPRRGCQLSRG